METKDLVEKIEKINKLELKRNKVTEISDNALARVHGAMVDQDTNYMECASQNTQNPNGCFGVSIFHC